MGATVEADSFAVISRELAEAIRAYQVWSAKLRKARRRYEKSPQQSPARELARKKLATATRNATRAEVALLMLADKEPIAYPMPELETSKSISARGPRVGELAPLSKRLERGTPEELRGMLPRR